ncbi:zinc-ribbon domain containing protein [Allorhodopirellula solitaria]|uniref:Probable zinc-binding domain-containing protein n=1 Tax=Allorhodopirellula solitaria TaxID=2527987 RepID=A0A5C5XPE8_9BACT|nr:zinc-ribbon domain containing protein [Allorhodopirellula solitaria]TWT64784.1 hypothetical protein CA85_35690 [Allorhodopirellula solitaria]
MTRKTDKYGQFADHPRYGSRPNVTNSNPSPMDRGVHLHWNATTRKEIVAQYESVTGKRWPYADHSAYCELSRRIPNTAIPADLTRQTPAIVAVTHYFDLERRCRDCSRSFIFFAEEQKHWYEQLGFGLDSDCVRCVDCRKTLQGIARQRERYESLFHVPNKTEKQSMEMAEACLSLIEKRVFTRRQTERVRMLLNSIPDDPDARKPSQYTDLVQRVVVLETKDDEGCDSPN